MVRRSPAVSVAFTWLLAGCVRSSDTAPPARVRSQGNDPIDASTQSAAEPRAADAHEFDASTRMEDASDGGCSSSIVTLRTLVRGASAQPDLRAAVRWLREQHSRSSLRGSLSSLSARGAIDGAWFERDADGCTALQISRAEHSSWRVERAGTLDGAPARVTHTLTFVEGLPTVTLTFRGDGGTLELVPEHGALSLQNGSDDSALVRLGVSRTMSLAGPRYERITRPLPDAGRYSSAREVRASQWFEVVRFDERELHMLRAPVRVVSFRGPPTMIWFRSRAECENAPPPPQPSTACDDER